MNITKRIGSFILSLLLVFSMFGSTFTIQTFAATKPALSVESKFVNINEQFTVSVFLANSTSVYGGNFTLQYDSSLLSVDSYEFGSIVSGHTKNCNLDYQSAGNLIRFTFSGASALSSDGTLVTFTFTAKSKGSAKLQFNAYKMYDENGGSIETESSNGTLKFVELGETITGIYNDLLLYNIVDGKVTITACHSATSGSVTIPSTIEGFPVTSIGDYAFEGCRKITSFFLPTSIVDIGDSAFNACSSLVSINVDNNNTNFSSVDGVLFNEDKTVLIQYPVAKTNSEYAIPNTVASIGVNAFCACKNLTSINIPTSVTNIDNGAFCGCTNLNSIIIPNGVTSIGNSAFSYCENLNSIIIPDSVTSIGSYVFSNCTSLTTATIGKSVTSIGASVFSECTVFSDVFYNGFESDWENISIDTNNDILLNATIHYLTIEVPFEYSIENNCVTITGYTGTDTDVVIPSTIEGMPVTTLGNKVFYECSDITSITLPDSVTSIGRDAFRECTNLVSINIPNGVTNIGSSAFYNCDNLTSIIIPNSVKNIEPWAFASCNKLTSVTMPDSITNISDYAFYYCENLISVTIPEGVTNIGKNAFYYCTSLPTITIPGSVETISDNAFYYCESITSITIPGNVTNIGEYTFRGCTNLMSINVDENNDCYSSVDGVLFNKDKTTLIQYPANKTISEYIIPDSVTSIDDFAFRYCDSLTSITISDSVTSIGDYVFENCTSLTTITIPDSVTSIGEWAFGYCENLASITIPYNVTIINDSAFYYCKGLKNVYYLGLLSEWDNITIGSNNSYLTNANISHLCTYGDWVTNYEPTCAEEGSRSKTCLVCGDVVTETISTIGHLNTTWVTEQEPSCSEPGYKDEYCLDCGEKIGTESIPATGHKYSTEWTIDVAPTCTEEGSKSHLCTVCGEKGDVTVIIALGHDFKVVSTESEHPHTTLYKCSRCTETKEETSVSSGCAICNFTYTNVDDTTCKITGYIGSENSFVIPGTISGRTVTTTTTGAFKNNTTLVSVKIEDGVQGLGSLAFLGCKSLSKIVIPESVVSIGANAFYNCASDFTIYCFQDSYAMQYAIDNSFNYIIMDVGETEYSRIDYINKIIFTTLKSSESIEDIIYIPSSSMAFAEASLISGNNEYLGTGSIVTVFDDNNNLSEYTLIVEGDLNGDSVCNVLDAFEAERASNGHIDASTEQIYAANGMVSDEINASSYQNVVNKALAS